MSQGTKRSILRWIHIVFSIPIIGYIYSPFEELPKYAPRDAVCLLSDDCPFGIVDVERPSSSTASRERIDSAGEKRRIGENMKPTSRPNGEAASANITKRIQELGDWRGETLAHVRQLIHDADPDIQEEWKWVRERPRLVP